MNDSLQPNGAFIISPVLHKITPSVFDGQYPMKDGACIQFLQWALPQLQLRWAGFRRVRKQVCKRIGRRIAELGLADVAAYREYLHDHAVEWHVLAGLCRVTISRFYRDQAVFRFLGKNVLPQLCDALCRHGEKELRCWSAGCARGEEAYSLVLLWQLTLQERYPDMRVSVTATDIDPEMIRQAQRACYEYSSVKNLSPAWRQTAFEQIDDHYCLRPEYQRPVVFQQGDVEAMAFAQPYHLVCCRNLVCTYFHGERQVQFLNQLQPHMPAGGALVLGAHERLPEGVIDWRRWHPRLPVYLRE
jgi:chemotaxis protein methyltransferase CheR